MDFSVAKLNNPTKKITSTPMGIKLGGHHSPSVSRIFQGSPCTSRESSLSGRSRNITKFWLDDNSEYEDSENEPINADVFSENIKYFKKFSKFNINGYFGKIYKPVDNDEDSLYYQLLTNPKNAMSTATEFAEKAVKSPFKTTTYYLYKFVLDCAAHQKFPLQSYFSYPPNIENIIKKMQSYKSKAEYQTTHKYLFGEISIRFRTLKVGICKFFEQIILEANNHDLLFNEAFNFLFQLLEAMCNSDLIPLVITGATFVLHVVTALCIIKHSVNADSSKVHENQLVDDFINNMYLVLRKLCKLQPKILNLFKADFMDELILWIHYCPNVFIDYFNGISTINKFLHDTNKSVRKAALNFAELFIQDEDLLMFFKHSSVKELANYIVSRFDDIDDMVALRALEVYFSFLARKFEINRKIFEKLMKIVYNEDYRKGSASAKCLIYIIKQDQDENVDVLLNFCEITKKYYPTLKAVFVESFNNHTTVFQNWYLFVNVLRDPHYSEIDIELKITLSELLFESVHQVVTGKSSIGRLNSTEGEKCDLKVHQNIARVLYPHFRIIIVSYKDEPAIPKNYFKAILELSPDIMKQNIQYIKELMIVFMKLFETWSDQKVLEALLEFLDRIKIIPDVAQPTVESLKEFCYNKLADVYNLEDVDHGLKLKKLSLILNNQRFKAMFNCSELEFLKIPKDDIEYVGEKLEINYWIMARKIQNIPRLSHLEQHQQITYLLIEMKSLITTCMKLMENEDINLKLKGYERFCESCIGLSNELENISKQITALNKLKPSYETDVVLREKVVEVFELTVSDKHIPLDMKYKYAMNLVNIACHEIFSMEIISYLLMHYEVSYNIYGKFIEDILSDISEQDENWIPLLIANAISLCLELYNKKYGVVETLSTKAKSVLKLCRKFAEYKLVKKHNNVFLLIFYIINYAVDHNAYDILTFVAVFCDSLHSNQAKCKELLDHLKKKIPATHAKHDAVLYFANKLKSRGTSKSAVNKSSVPTKKPKIDKISQSKKSRTRSKESTTSSVTLNRPSFSSHQVDVEMTDVQSD